MHGNFLLDVLESSYSVDQIAILENIFKNNATIPFLLLTSTISLNTFGLVALGMGLGVLLFALVFVALWNNT